MLLVLLSNFSMKLLDKSILRNETSPKNASVGILSMAFRDKFRVSSCSNPSKAFLLSQRESIERMEFERHDEDIYLPDVIDLIVVKINFKDDWKLAESGFGQFGDFVALVLNEKL